MEFLAERKNSGILSSDWAELEELYVKKLWHQLTLKCLNFVRKPEFKQGTVLIDVISHFINNCNRNKSQLNRRNQKKYLDV